MTTLQAQFGNMDAREKRDRFWAVFTATLPSAMNMSAQQGPIAGPGKPSVKIDAATAINLSANMAVTALSIWDGGQGSQAGPGGRPPLNIEN